MTPSGIKPATSRLVAHCLSIRMYPKHYLKKRLENFGGYAVAPDFPIKCRFHIHFAKYRVIEKDGRDLKPL